MIFEEFDLDEVLERVKEDEREEGRELGRREEREQISITMLHRGLSVEQISEYMSQPLSYVREIESRILEMVHEEGKYQ